MKDIKGYEGLYAITEDGKVWSYAKRWHKGQFLFVKVCNGKYPKVGLWKNHKVKYFLLHPRQ